MSLYCAAGMVSTLEIITIWMVILKQYFFHVQLCHYSNDRSCKIIYLSFCKKIILVYITNCQVCFKFSVRHVYSDENTVLLRVLREIEKIGINHVCIASAVDVKIYGPQ